MAAAHINGESCCSDLSSPTAPSYRSKHCAGAEAEGTSKMLGVIVTRIQGGVGFIRCYMRLRMGMGRCSPHSLQENR